MRTHTHMQAVSPVMAAELQKTIATASSQSDSSCLHDIPLDENQRLEFSILPCRWSVISGRDFLLLLLLLLARGVGRREPHLVTITGN